MLRPKGVSLHYEVELGLVIGKTLRDLDPEDHQGALDAIDSAIPPSLGFKHIARVLFGSLYCFCKETDCFCVL